MARIKVLLLLHELSRTGAPKIAVEAFSQMQDRVETWAISLQPGPLAEPIRAFAPLHPVEMPQATNALISLRRRIGQRMRRARLARWHPDLIYVNSVASLPIAQKMPLPDAPVLLHVHELDLLLEWYERAEPRLLREWPDRYIAVAEVVRDVLVQRHQIPQEKITCIPAFFNDREVQAFSSRAMESAAGTAGVFTVGGAGRIQWRKGFELWLQTAAYLKARMGTERIRFVWVGGENDMHEREMRLTARKLGVEDIVTIIPMTPEPLPHYQEFDAFLMTSWEDPFPIVVLENMALGRPIVCVRGGGGSSEQVGETGIVIEGFSAVEIGNALQELAANPDRRRQLGEAARERALTCFTASSVVPRIWEEIQRMVPR